MYIREKELEQNPQVLTVKYERIVKNYMAEMKNIMEFIGEDYVENINRYPHSSQILDSVAWFRGVSKVHNKSLQRWRKEEHEKVVSELLQLGGAQELLKHYEYM
jgi:nicotinic acid mononucleotide adenylyltransferase